MIGKDRLQGNQTAVSDRRWQHRRTARMLSRIALAGLLATGALRAQDAPPQDPAAAAADSPAAGGTPNGAAVKYRLFYRNVDPKQLFLILQETYHVQFQGADTVTGLLTLISPGDEMVDLDGMLTLLNQVLSAQDKIARREGSLIRIVPRQRRFDYFIELKYAEPDKVIKILQDLFQAQPDKPEDRGKKAEYIQQHPSQRGIIVRGPEEVYKEIIEYIEKTKIDVPPAGQVNGTTPTTAPRTVEMQGPLFREYIALDYMDPAEFQALLVQDETLKGKFTSAVARNTLIVFSREEEVFAKIKETKKAFDVDRLEIRYLPLANAQAEDIAALLAKIYPPQASPEELAVPAEVQSIRRTGVEEPGIPVDLREDLRRIGMEEPQLEALLSGAISVVAAGEFTIVPDKTRNALLIRTYSRNFPKILELIKELDKALRQVLIDVFITEVSLDDTMEFGVDFTYKHNELTNTLQQRYQGTTEVPTAFPQPVGITYQLISNNITTFIRALEQNNNFDVISRPQIVTKDNGKATISLGRDVPMIKDTRVSTEGAISSTINYQKVATELEVTPQIHPDDYVTLTLKQTIDDVSAETFQISQNFNPQVLIRRSADTSVRVRNGQTVCLGGFVGDSIVENESKVPILGNIPLLGMLFSYTSHQRIKTELLIFITPHILETPQEMLRMTNEMRRRSHAEQNHLRNTDVLEPQRFLEYPPYRDPLPIAPIPGENQVIDKPERSAEPPAPETQPETQPQEKPPAEAAAAEATPQEKPTEQKEPEQKAPQEKAPPAAPAAPPPAPPAGESKEAPAAPPPAAPAAPAEPAKPAG